MLLQLSHQHSTIMLLLASYLSGDGEWGRVFSVVLIRSQSQAGTVSLRLGGMTCSVLLQLQFWAQHFFLSLLRYWAESGLPTPIPTLFPHLGCNGASLVALLTMYINTFFQQRKQEKCSGGVLCPFRCCSLHPGMQLEGCFLRTLANVFLGQEGTARWKEPTRGYKTPIYVRPSGAPLSLASPYMAFAFINSLTIPANHS